MRRFGRKEPLVDDDVEMHTHSPQSSANPSPSKVDEGRTESSSIGETAAITQWVTRATKALDENDNKKGQDEEAIEVGVAAITGFRPTWIRRILFYTLFLSILGGLGIVSWVWPGGVLEEWIPPFKGPYWTPPKELAAVNSTNSTDTNSTDTNSTIPDNSTDTGNSTNTNGTDTNGTTTNTTNPTNGTANGTDAGGNETAGTGSESGSESGSEAGSESSGSDDDDDPLMGCTINFGVDTNAANCGDQRIGFCVAIILIFGGCEILWFYWFPSHYLRLIATKETLDKCPMVMVTATDLTRTPCEVIHKMDPSGTPVRLFYFRNCTFVWNSKAGNFTVLVPTIGPSVLYNNDGRIGLSKQTSDNLIAWFGANLIDVPLPSIITLLLQEVLSPFTWFQLFSIVIWSMENFYFYAIVIFILTFVFAFISLYTTRTNIVSIRNMSRFITPVTVIQNGEEKRVMSDQVAPGEIVVIESKTTLPFDAILLTGETIMNEAMLTGESIPVLKVAFNHPQAASFQPDDIPSIHKLACGTVCIQAKPDSQQKDGTPKQALAQVWKTGFSTAKGRLVRSILFPQPARWDIYRDGFRFVGIMIGVAAIACIISGYYYSEIGLSASRIFLYSLDILVTVVPPALPTSLLTGITLSVNRLKKKSIYCISPPRVVVAGKVDMVLFDKTGTLTEEGLELRAIVPVSEKKLEEVKADLLRDINQTGDTGKIDLTTICATCHSLRYLSSETDKKVTEESKAESVHTLNQSSRKLSRQNINPGELIGDPLEVAMFNATGWTLNESPFIFANDEERYAFSCAPPSGSTNTMRVVKTYTFSSALQRMAIIARNTSTKELMVMVKGTPEIITTLCRPDTIPESAKDIMESYTKCGFRVLAAASRLLDPNMDYNELNLSDAEGKNELSFKGLIIFENKIKPESAPTIARLHEASLGTVMVTGDHALTAIYVARTLGMLPANEDTAKHPALENKEDSKAQLKTVQKDAHNYTFVADMEEGRLIWKNANTNEVLTEDAVKSLGLTPLELGDQNNSEWNPRKRIPGGKVYPSESLNLESISANLLRAYDPRRIDSGSRNTSALSLVITGRAFEHLCNEARTDSHHRQHLDYLLEKLVVAARFTPSQKQLLVRLYGDLGHITAFCGDGANDCGALKAADVGLSLSPDAEASVAAPFTSRITNISSMVELLKEGRCALATAFAEFKYMALFAFIEGSYDVQTYIMGAYLGDFMYLLDDIFLNLPLVTLLAYTGPNEELTKEKPTATLISVPVLSSVFGQIAICTGFMFIARRVVREEPYYFPHPIAADDVTFYEPGFEPTVIFWVANFQLVWTCWIYSAYIPFPDQIKSWIASLHHLLKRYVDAAEFRLPVYTNFPFLTATFFGLFLCTYCVYAPNPKWFLDLMDAMEFPLESNIRDRVFGICWGCFFTLWVYEQIVQFARIYSKEKKDKIGAEFHEHQELYYEKALSEISYIKSNSVRSVRVGKVIEEETETETKQEETSDI